MNKYIVLILAFMVIFADSNDELSSQVLECLQKLAGGGFQWTYSGIDAFGQAYFYSTSRIIARENSKTLSKYYNEIYKSVTENFPEEILLSPEKWCFEKYLNDPICKRNLLVGGYKYTVLGQPTELSSLEALEYSYKKTNLTFMRNKNDQTQEYYRYIFQTCQPILHTISIRSPFEYCMNRPANSIPTVLAGHYLGQTISNEHINVQVQDQNQNAGEGSSRVNNVATDNEDTISIRNPMEYCMNQSANSLPSVFTGHYVGQTISNEHINVQVQDQYQNAGEGSSQVNNVATDNEGKEIDLNKNYYED